MLWVHKRKGAEMMQLSEMDRQLEAIEYAAEKLGCKLSEVKERTEKIRRFVAVQPIAHDIRQYVINMRGWDMPPQFGTGQFLDLQLERLIDMLASDEQRAEENALAARFGDAFDEGPQNGRGVSW